MFFAGMIIRLVMREIEVPCSVADQLICGNPRKYSFIAKIGATDPPRPGSRARSVDSRRNQFTISLAGDGSKSVSEMLA
uniref:Uncharacterized protein n=1 Tax=Anopheles darlingi TaxID=43151 RepID=A0A2M4DBZ6_ANODA